MLTRRELLSTAIAGSAAFVAGAALVRVSVAQAFTEVPMPPDVAAEYALGCSGVSNSGHNQLIQTALAALKGEIASGTKPAGAEEIVVCPLCGCRIVVSASN
jgi:hypothetical protein